MGKKSARVVVVGGAVALATIASVSIANAKSIGTVEGLGARVTGSIWLQETAVNQFSWVFTVKDISANGFCAQAKVIIDLPDFPDRQYSSPRACGNGVSVTWDHDPGTESPTMRGVKIQVCRVHSDGDDQYCETEKYVDAPTG